MMLSELRHNTNPTNTPAGRLCSKLQDFTATANTYAYSPNAKPHAVRRYYNGLTNELYSLLWDANGNLAQIAEYNYDPATEITTLQDFRNHYWDEDDRLNLVLDNSHFSYYLYSNDGQRVAKLTGSAFTLGTGFATNAMLDNYTLYPSEYLVITQQGYTKYYYANGTRIASKLGSGGFEKMTRLCTLDQNLTANANILFSSVVANIGTAMPDYHISDPCPSYYSDIAGFRVQLPTLNIEPNFGITAQQNILQTFRQNYANEETYFFHGNHLGSANWVTLQNASPTQFLLHLPYGEEFVKQLSGSYDERFTFTGKEKDIETGYYYFGARFDNVDLGFMSVDPMADKYPSMSPYAYCAWNPVKLVDPEGEDWYQSDDGTAVLWQDKTQRTIKIDGVVYNNIGVNYSAKIAGGHYMNYYQSHAISISKYPRNSREDLIYDNRFFNRHFKSLTINEQKDIFNARVASRGVKPPDFIGVQFRGSAIVGGGYTLDITIGFMRNKGLFGALSVGAGFGFDLSVGGGLTWGNYQGSDMPSVNNWIGTNYTGSVGVALFYQESNSTNGLWHNRTIGGSLPFKFGCSIGVNSTLKTFR